MSKICRKCKINKHISHFINRDYKINKTNITITCFKCRFYNASRFIAKEQNTKEKIWQILRNENIKKTYIYSIYQNQQMCCFLCNRHVNIPLVYVNKINDENPYKDNIFLSCMYCYYIRDDEPIDDFVGNLEESSYPFNNSTIKKEINDNKRNDMKVYPFTKYLLGY